MSSFFGIDILNPDFNLFSETNGKDIRIWTLFTEIPALVPDRSFKIITVSNRISRC
jgi:hypothetical protein